MYPLSNTAVSIKPLFENFNNFGNTLDTIELSNKLIQHPFISTNGTSYYFDCFKTINTHYDLNLFKFYDHYMEYLNVPTMWRVLFMLLLVISPMLVSKFYDKLFRTFYNSLFEQSVRDDESVDYGKNNEPFKHYLNYNDYDEPSAPPFKDPNEPLIDSDVTITQDNIIILSNTANRIAAREAARDRAIQGRDTIHVIHPDDYGLNHDKTEIFNFPDKTMYSKLHGYLTEYTRTSTDPRTLLYQDYQEINQLISDENISQLIVLLI
jgi:hypothetical protein